MVIKECFLKKLSPLVSPEGPVDVHLADRVCPCPLEVCFCRVELLCSCAPRLPVNCSSGSVSNNELTLSCSNVILCLLSHKWQLMVGWCPHEGSCSLSYQKNVFEEIQACSESGVSRQRGGNYRTSATWRDSLRRLYAVLVPPRSQLFSSLSPWKPEG